LAFQGVREIISIGVDENRNQTIGQDYNPAKH